MLFDLINKFIYSWSAKVALISLTPMDKIVPKKSHNDLALSEVDTGVSVKSPKM